MATILDVGLVQYFQVIYPVLFVFAIVFALLQKTKALGQSSLAVNLIISFAVSFMILLSDAAVKLLSSEHNITKARVQTKPLPIPLVPWNSSHIHFLFEN